MKSLSNKSKPSTPNTMQNKTFLIISREYTSRVKKKSFIIMTILLPVLMAALIFVPVLVMLHSERSQHTRVLVVDDTEIFLNTFEENENRRSRTKSSTVFSTSWTMARAYGATSTIRSPFPPPCNPLWRAR